MEGSRPGYGFKLTTFPKRSPGASDGGSSDEVSEAAQRQKFYNVRGLICSTYPKVPMTRVDT